MNVSIGYSQVYFHFLLLNSLPLILTRSSLLTHMWVSSHSTVTGSYMDQAALSPKAYNFPERASDVHFGHRDSERVNMYEPCYPFAMFYFLETGKSNSSTNWWKFLTIIRIILLYISTTYFSAIININIFILSNINNFYWNVHYSGMYLCTFSNLLIILLIFRK